MADFTGRVVVKLIDTVQVPYEDGAQASFDQALADAWAAVGNAFGTQLSLDRWLPEFDASQLGALPGMTSWFAVAAPPDVDVEALAGAIFQLPFVETAYPEERAELAAPPSQTPDDPEFPNERHLQPAPAGVDALSAWTNTKGDGEGTRLIDIEEDWDLNHRDLPSVTLGSGQRQGGIEHGTNVLGLIAAIPENTTDCIGIAPAVAVEVVPVVRDNGVEDRASAFVAATLDLVPVDPNGPTPVILMPLQVGGQPVEAEPGFAAMVFAVVGLGIAVVEAAGNFHVDLDAFIPPQGAPNPFHRSEFDSGAIIVGACKGPNDPNPLEPMNGAVGGTSSFGTRVDCFAQGKDVVTLSADPVNTVTHGFGGTSAASSIVAATAAIVSALFTEANGTPIPPRDLRQLLSDSAVNTASASPAADLIGSMPDLAAIIANGF